MIDRAQVQVGMLVRDVDGLKLGKVMWFDTGTIRVEKRSIFGDREYVVRYTDVENADRFELWLCVSEGDLQSRLGNDEGRSEDDEAPGIETQTVRVNAGTGHTRYEEISVRVNEEDGGVQNRKISHDLANEDRRDATRVPGSRRGDGGGEDPLSEAAEHP